MHGVCQFGIFFSFESPAVCPSQDLLQGLGLWSSSLYILLYVMFFFLAFFDSNIRLLLLLLLLHPNVGLFFRFVGRISFCNFKRSSFVFSISVSFVSQLFLIYFELIPSVEFLDLSVVLFLFFKSNDPLRIFLP